MEAKSESDAKFTSLNGCRKASALVEDLFAFRPRLNNRISCLVEGDDAVGMHEILSEERKKLGLGAKHAGSKRNKRNKSGAVKEDEPFVVLLRLVLQYACIYDSADCTSLLVSGEEELVQVYVDTCDDMDHRTPLHHAALHHSSRCIEVLLRDGANPGVRSKAGLCPLEEALQSPEIKVEWGPDTPAAHVVARLREKDLTAARLLAEKSKDQLIRVAFRLASEGQLIPLVALLLVTRGSFVNTVARGADYTGCDEDGSGTLVDLLVGKVLQASSPVSSKPKAKQISSLHAGEWGLPSANEGQETVERANNKARAEAMRMLEAVLIFNPRLSGHPQSLEISPLLRAAQTNDGVLVGLLLDANAPVNDTDTDGNTALHWALRQATPGNGREVDNRLVKRLLEAGANVLHGNKLGATPVHTAAGHGHAEALRMILEKEPSGSNVMAATKETPLHYAVKNNHLECAEVLLQFGANRHVVSLRNQRPGQLAPSPEMRALLQEPEPSPATAPGDPHKAAWEAASFSSHLQPQASASLWNRSSSEDSEVSWGLQPSHMPAYRTALCRFHLSPEGCSYGAKCHFAHTEEELRAYGAAEHPVRGPSSDALDLQSKAYKTKMCQHFEKGMCPHGSKCKFAHGEAELRGFAVLGRGIGRPSTASSLASSASDDEDYNARKVFVGGLPHFIKSEDLWEHFEGEFGRVRDAVVICGLAEEGSQRSRGFGFVLFEDPNDAYEAVRRHWVPFRGRRVEVKPAQARAPSPSETEAFSLQHSTAGSDRMPPPSYRPTPASISSSTLSSPQAPLSPALSSRSLRGDDTVALFNDGVQISAGSGGAGYPHNHGFGPAPGLTQGHSFAPPHSSASHTLHQQHGHPGGGPRGGPPPGWSLPPLSVPSPAVQSAQALAASIHGSAPPLPPHSFLPPVYPGARPPVHAPGGFGQPGPFPNSAYSTYQTSPGNGLFSHDYSSGALVHTDAAQQPAGASLETLGGPAASRSFQMDSGAVNSSPLGQHYAGDGAYYSSQQPYSFAGNNASSASVPFPSSHGFNQGYGGSNAGQAPLAGDDDDISELLALLNPGANGLSSAGLNGSATAAAAAAAASQPADSNGRQSIHQSHLHQYSSNGERTPSFAHGDRSAAASTSIYHLPNFSDFLSG